MSIFTSQLMMSQRSIKLFIGAISLFVLFGFSISDQESKAISQIKEIHEGAIFVRLHTDDAVLAKLKSLHYDKTYRKKVKEINASNKEVLAAFTSGYSFSKVYFFFSRDSEKIRNENFENVFVNSDLEIDTTIHFNSDTPFYVVDIGDVYFEHINGHMEGIVVLDRQFNQLKKPFPFYVRKRSGFAILKRTDVDMALILDKKFQLFYDKAVQSASIY
tara:strand:+ start:67580 stop:68230 length:651 start_codon:yes stop_codon:yes gene_type:complete